MSTSQTQSTESFDGFHELKETPRDLLIKKLETIRDKALQYLLNNKKLRTSVGEQDADGKTFLVGWQNLSRPTDPPIVFCLARVVGSVQASVGEQDAYGNPVCCVRLKLDEEDSSSDHEDSSSDDKPVCCVRLKLDEEDPSSDHEDSSSDDKPVCCVRLKLDEEDPSSDHEDSSSDDKPVCCVKLDDEDLYE